MASSPPIGIGRTGLRETSVPLRTGSVACLFTDGLLEARLGDGLFGRERLTAMVAELGPEEQADALLEFVIAAADEAPDDMAVVLIRPVSGVEVSPRASRPLSSTRMTSTAASASASSRPARYPTSWPQTRSTRRARRRLAPALPLSRSRSMTTAPACA